MAEEPSRAYLERCVFPTLLPGIEKLLVLVKDRSKTTGADAQSIDPLVWLATHLYRHNPTAKREDMPVDEIPFIKQHREQLAAHVAEEEASRAAKAEAEAYLTLGHTSSEDGVHVLTICNRKITCSPHSESKDYAIVVEQEEGQDEITVAQLFEKHSLAVYSHFNEKAVRAELLATQIPDELAEQLIGKLDFSKERAEQVTDQVDTTTEVDAQAA
eukprot:Colp12_sorted_trinity150504_noHs@23034